MQIHGETIRRRLNEAGEIGETARNRVGRLLWNAYFTEQGVRYACADLLDPSLLVCDPGGFTEIAGIRHGTVGALARLLGISSDSIASRLASSGLATIKGKANGGQLVDLWPEPLVRKLCTDLIGKVCCDTDGFAIVSNVRYATKATLHQMWGLSPNTVNSRIAKSHIEPISGRDSQGRPCDLYPEPAVREACANLLGKPTCGLDGFVVVGGVQHGTVAAFARFFDI
ncbi:hypothetical protein HZA44_03745, partial [Candidatus Peregrinibacteria bacterium]|nr:hypothetical protein [Candidatus Peregrinibacteria bacterium]